MPQRKDYINNPLPIAKDLKKLFNATDHVVIFDIGACEGEDSIRYSRLFTNGKVYAFEPLPKNIELAKQNIEAYKATNVTLVPLAFSDKKGTAVFHVSSGTPEGQPPGEDWDYGNKSSSLLPPDKLLSVHKWLKFNEQLEVAADTITNFCTTHHIQTIDFMHMDVQGAELMVLNGAGNLISNIKAIWMEVGDISFYKNQPLRTDVEAFMHNHGFFLFKNSINPIDKAGDQLYLNTKYYRPNRFKWFNLFPVKKLLTNNIKKGL